MWLTCSPNLSSARLHSAFLSIITPLSMSPLLETAGMHKLCWVEKKRAQKPTKLAKYEDKAENSLEN